MDTATGATAATSSQEEEEKHLSQGKEEEEEAIIPSSSLSLSLFPSLPPSATPRFVSSDEGGGRGGRDSPSAGEILLVSLVRWLS